MITQSKLLTVLKHQSSGGGVGGFHEPSINDVLDESRRAFPDEGAQGRSARWKLTYANYTAVNFKCRVVTIDAVLHG